MSTIDTQLHSMPEASTSSTHDLWAIALGRQLGRRLAEQVGSIRACSTMSVHEIAANYGLAPEKAHRVSAILELARRLSAEPLVRGAAFRGSDDVFRHFAPSMRDLRQEQFWVVLLDGKHRVVSQYMVSQGTLTSSPVHPREVFARAIREGAAAMILVHNHPSGDPSPSADDIEITRRLCEVGVLVGIRVLDHIVVGDSSYASLAERGLLS